MFPVFMPSGGLCEGDGLSSIMAFDYKNGSQLSKPLFDINQDGTWTYLDTYIEDEYGVTHQVVGLVVGTGVISELTRSSGTTVSYINYSLAGGGSTATGGSGGGSGNGYASADNSNVSTGVPSLPPNNGGPTPPIPPLPTNPAFTKAKLKAWQQVID